MDEKNIFNDIQWEVRDMGGKGDLDSMLPISYHAVTFSITKQFRTGLNVNAFLQLPCCVRGPTRKPSANTDKKTHLNLFNY